MFSGFFMPIADSFQICVRVHVAYVCVIAVGCQFNSQFKSLSYIFWTH